MEQSIFNLSERLGYLLKQGGELLALAESCTGGGIAQAVTAVAGSSEWFDRGFVTYSNAAKQQMLAVPAATIEQYGAVSEQTALAMAIGALQHSDATVALSVTGVAGPGGGSDAKPVGTVWFGMATHQQSQAQLQHFAGDRAAVRAAAIEFALRWLLET